MFSSKEVKTEPEEADISLPVDHQPHSSCSDSLSTLAGHLGSREPKLILHRVKTECDLNPKLLLHVKTECDCSPESSSRTIEESGHPACVTVKSERNILIKNEAEVSTITEFKTDPADYSDGRLGGCMKRKTTKEEEIYLEETKSEGQIDTDLKPCKDVDKGKEKDGEKKHFCQLCGRGYLRTASLGVHMKTHTGERQHRCHECGAAFYERYTLKKHMIVHIETRTHICDKCGKGFPTLSYLKTHLKCHIEHHTKRHIGGDYTCTKCGKTFTRSRNLKTHQKTHTGVKAHTCTQCGTSFQRLGTLKKHMRIHTGERPYVCSECGKTFPYAFSHDYHIKHVHKKKVKPGKTTMQGLV